MPGVESGSLPKGKPHPDPPPEGEGTIERCCRHPLRRISSSVSAMLRARAPGRSAYSGVGYHS